MYIFFIFQHTSHFLGASGGVFSPKKWAFLGVWTRWALLDFSIRATRTPLLQAAVSAGIGSKNPEDGDKKKGIFFFLGTNKSQKS